jgi:ABC-2 type transport system ATP-binding protein
MPRTSEQPPFSIPDNAVELKGLTKTYPGNKRSGPKQALKGVDLAIPRGSVFGLLGPNGAGKSTMINILAGLVTKTSGTAKIWGIDIDVDPRQARAAIGVVPQELNIDAFFTPREMLELQAGMFGVPKAERRSDEILEIVGLADKAHAYTRSLSGGMRRRLLVAKSMVHNPPILVLDEPTAGVDVELRRKLWETIEALNANGVTVLLTTHYLEEAEALCDRIAIINHGEVIACDTTRNLIGRLDGKELLIETEDALSEVPKALVEQGFTLDSEGRLHVTYRRGRVKISRLLDAVRAAGLQIVDIETRQSDLEDVFVALTGTGDETETALSSGHAA